MKPAWHVLTALAVMSLTSQAAAQRRVERNRVYSDSLPAAVIALDSSLTYLGTQSFALYNVANAEQHFFAELDGKRIKRFVWVQFEGYLPTSHGRYNYSADSIIRLWDRPIYHRAMLRTTTTTEDRPESDGAKARQFVRDRGLTFSSTMLYHRLVSIVGDDARNELMIIYMEDPAAYSDSARALDFSLKRAERSIRMEKR
jgi:hypothetical protein